MKSNHEDLKYMYSIWITAIFSYLFWVVICDCKDNIHFYNFLYTLISFYLYKLDGKILYTYSCLYIVYKYCIVMRENIFFQEKIHIDLFL